MNTKQRIAAGLVLLGLGVLGGWFASQVYCGRHVRADGIASREIVNVAYLALLSCRTHGTDAMLSGMEGTLDRGVVELWRNRNRLSNKEQEDVGRLLSQVARYRVRYPRERGMDRSNENYQEESDKILLGFKGAP